MAARVAGRVGPVRVRPGWWEGESGSGTDVDASSVAQGEEGTLRRTPAMSGKVKRIALRRMTARTLPFTLTNLAMWHCVTVQQVDDTNMCLA